jgi:hypothetical protein
MLLLGSAAVAGAACVWAAGGQLRQTLRFMLVRRICTRAPRPHTRRSPRAPAQDVGVTQTNTMLQLAASVLAVLATVTPALAANGVSTADVTSATDTLRSASERVRAALEDNQGMAYGAAPPSQQPLRAAAARARARGRAGRPSSLRRRFSLPTPPQTA